MSTKPTGFDPVELPEAMPPAIRCHTGPRTSGAGTGGSATMRD